MLLSFFFLYYCVFCCLHLFLMCYFCCRSVGSNRYIYLFMKKILLLCAALLLCGAAAARERGVHRVVSCNIRVALPQDEESGNGWSVRKELCREVMKRRKADIYCLQEVTVGQYEDMCRMFPHYFVFGYSGPEMDAMPDREYHGIAKNLVMFSKKRYEMTGAGVYWLSETPLIGGSEAWGTARARHVSWVRLRDRRTGREFRVLSVHLDHISQEARLAQVRVVLDETGQYPGNIPQVLVGDFNSKPSNPVAKALTDAGWTDAFIQANGGDTHENSFHQFKGGAYRPKKGKPGRIDFIYLKGDGLRARASELVKDRIGGKYPSDHYFLEADVVME